MSEPRSAASPPRGLEVFGPAGAKARFGAPILVVPLLVLFLAGAIAAAVLGAVLGVVIAVAQGADPMAQEQVMTPATIGGLVGFFPGLAGAAVLWAVVAERRTLASLGLGGRGALWRYGRGLLGGVGLAAALAAAALPIAAATGQGEEARAALGPLAPGALLLIGAVMAFMLVQGACEEIVFRGWMLSRVAARLGVVWGVGVSSALFGLLHADRFVAGALVGLGAVAATSAVGLAFGVWAARERVIAGVCGAHGGFNATLIGLTLAGLAMQSGATDAGGLIAALFEELDAELSSVSALPLFAAQIALFGGLALVLAKGITRR